MTKSTLLGIALNVIFVLSIFTVRYYYAKQEMDFLLKDSERQEQLISDNESSIDSLSAVTRRLQIDNDTQDIIEYLKQSDSKKKKKFNFWKLLDTNE